MTQIFEVNILAIPKPRMTRSDRWKERECTSRYWDFKDNLIKKAKSIDYNLSNAFDITFILPFPKSYSKKKREELIHKPHQVKPDLDNLVKSVCDCFCKNDSSIHKINARKIWGEEPKIIIKDI